ncbi:MAG: hypothetical protein J0H98_03260 [Solirubrobacterales bacterium]|nr:hypothetical protein [Solirubrobacterales bacterium]
MGEGYVSVGVGRRLSVVTWPDPNGRLRTAVYGRHGGWSRVQAVKGATTTGANLDVGSDGTVILVDAQSRGNGDPRARVISSVLLPGARKFSRWRKISTRAGAVSFESDVVAGRAGRGTIVWSGPCPMGGGTNASYVDVRGTRFSKPREIPNSSCVPFDLDLEQDNKGRQYLRIGGSPKIWLGVRLSIRQPNRRFSRMRFVSTPGEFTDGGDLAVSPNGRVTMVWGTQEPGGLPRAYEFVSFSHGRFPGPPREIEGLRLDVTKKRDILSDIAPLPRGRITMLWREHWTDSHGRWRFKLGIKDWRPGTHFSIPDYRYPISAKYIPYPARIRSGPDGSTISIWGKDANSGTQGLNWVHSVISEP